jgi:hypothetical protein
MSDIYAGEVVRLREVFFRDINERGKAIRKVVEGIGLVELVGKIDPWLDEERNTVRLALGAWSDVGKKRVKFLIEKLRKFWNVAFETGWLQDFSSVKTDFSQIFVDYHYECIRQLTSAANLIMLGFSTTRESLKVMVETQILKNDCVENERFLMWGLSEQRSMLDRGPTVAWEREEQSRCALEYRLEENARHEVSDLDRRLEENVRQQQFILDSRLEENAKQKRAELSRRLEERTVRAQAAFDAKLEEQIERVRTAFRTGFDERAEGVRSALLASLNE